MFAVPLVRVEILEGRSERIRTGILDAVHAALVSALGIPVSDRTARLIEHARDHLALDEGRSDDSVLVEITMFPGRSRRTKEGLYEAIVHELGALGVPGRDVTIVLHEPPMENWGLRGGIPADELDLDIERDRRDPFAD